MRHTERVADNLNGALHRLFERDPRVYLLGEDLLDPYGGAFKISRGLSDRYPDRVLANLTRTDRKFTADAGVLLDWLRP